MLKKSKIILSFFLLILITGFAYALDVPNLAGSPLHDKAEVLSQTEFQTLKSSLMEIDSRKNFQQAILIVKSLEGSDIESYAIEVFEKWKLGKVGKDNGVLIVVAINDKRMRIEVGYGLEGILTDAMAGAIIRNIIAPNFQKNKYFEGLQKATDAIKNIVEGDGSVVKEQLQVSNDRDEILSDIISIVIIIIIFLIISSKKTGFISSGGGSYGGGFGGGGFSSGGGGFSGGGGSSGGGGASGGW
ncbi:MAG: TPM domain-containing protein [Treponemataceae bacterium]